MTHPDVQVVEGAEVMLLILVSLLCSVPAAKACLQCDRRIRLLHEDFVLSAPSVGDQIELKKICDYAYVTYRQTSQKRKGVIGEINYCVFVFFTQYEMA